MFNKRKKEIVPFQKLSRDDVLERRLRQIRKEDFFCKKTDSAELLEFKKIALKAVTERVCMMDDREIIGYVIYMATEIRKSFSALKDAGTAYEREVDDAFGLASFSQADSDELKYYVGKITHANRLEKEHRKITKMIDDDANSFCEKVLQTTARVSRSFTEDCVLLIAFLFRIEKLYRIASRCWGKSSTYHKNDKERDARIKLSIQYQQISETVLDQIGYILAANKILEEETGKANIAEA